MYSVVNLTEDLYSSSFLLINANRLLKKEQKKEREREKKRASSVYKILGSEFKVLKK